MAEAFREIAKDKGVSPAELLRGMVETEVREALGGGDQVTPQPSVHDASTAAVAPEARNSVNAAATALAHAWEHLTAAADGLRAPHADAARDMAADAEHTARRVERLRQRLRHG